MVWSDLGMTARTRAPFTGSLGHHLDARLARLLLALDQEDGVERALHVAAVLTHSWRERPVLPWPEWPSDITDDHTPFEFSLSMDAHDVTVRLLTEPQDPAAPSLAASWRAGNEVHEALAGRWGTSFESYAAISDLFAPSAASEARFCLWHSGIMSRDGDPQFKVYLNPCIHGVDDAPTVLRAALARLGLEESWSRFAAATFVRGAADVPLYFSLDLTELSAARVKIYIAHRDATASDIARVLRTSPGFDERRVQRWCRELLGSAGPFHARPPISCFALSPRTLELHSTTLHLPVRCYRSDDLELAQSACRFMTFQQRVRYMRALTAASDRPLDSGAGLQTYVSLRASPGKQAVTSYLAPQLYSTAADRAEPVGFWAGLAANEQSPRQWSAKGTDT